MQPAGRGQLRHQWGEDVQTPRKVKGVECFAVDVIAAVGKGYWGVPTSLAVLYVG